MQAILCLPSPSTCRKTGIPRLLSAELAPQGAATTGALRRATDDGPGLTLSFDRNRRPGRAAQRAANQRAGVAANLLADGGPGATTQC